MSAASDNCIHCHFTLHTELKRAGLEIALLAIGNTFEAIQPSFPTSDLLRTSMKVPANRLPDYGRTVLCHE